MDFLVGGNKKRIFPAVISSKLRVSGSKLGFPITFPYHFLSYYYVSFPFQLLPYEGSHLGMFEVEVLKPLILGKYLDQIRGKNASNIAKLPVKCHVQREEKALQLDVKFVKGKDVSTPFILLTHSKDLTRVP